MDIKKDNAMYMQIAQIAAGRSYAKRLQVGCVIVKNNSIISFGWNGMPTGYDNCCEEEIDGKVPAEQLETIISQDLTENYAIKHLAVEWKVTEDYTFEDLKAQMEEKNDAQSDSADTTDSYGLTAYDISKYYSYWYSNLQTKLMNQMIGNSKDYSDAQDVEAYITEKAEKAVIRPGGASATDVILETFAQ